MDFGSPNMSFKNNIRFATCSLKRTPVVGPQSSHEALIPGMKLISIHARRNQASVSGWQRSVQCPSYFILKELAGWDPQFISNGVFIAWQFLIGNFLKNDFLKNDYFCMWSDKCTQCMSPLNMSRYGNASIFPHFMLDDILAIFKNIIGTGW